MRYPLHYILAIENIGHFYKKPLDFVGETVDDFLLFRRQRSGYKIGMCHADFEYFKYYGKITVVNLHLGHIPTAFVFPLCRKNHGDAEERHQSALHDTVALTVTEGVVALVFIAKIAVQETTLACRKPNLCGIVHQKIG